MQKIGLAVITKGLTVANLQSVYKLAEVINVDRLYLSVRGSAAFNHDWKVNIATCYSTATTICPELDIRLLLPHNENNVKERQISVIFCDNTEMKRDGIKSLISYLSNNIPDALYSVKGDGETIIEPPVELIAPFNNVCLGGTFDRLHNGHKILLSLSALKTKKRLFCGVSSDEMIKDKCLMELIEPLSERINACKTFLEDVRPGLQYIVESIDHAFGPTVTDPEFDCIIGSLETKRGCEKINEVRKEKGFSQLFIELIDMVDRDIEKLLFNNYHKFIYIYIHISYNEVTDESKLSSTKCRLGLLGKMLKPANYTFTTGNPYIIGLTGGIASGKSSIAKKLNLHGAEVIDCDKLGHEAYKPGTECFKKIVAEFGKDIVENNTGEIHRAKLGSVVFRDSQQMQRLTDIVWPEIGRLVKVKINEMIDGGRKVKTKIVVIDAAVLLDAGWQHFCNEVWVSFIPRINAIKRIQDRNKLTVAEAEKRIDSQKQNMFYIDAANVVFCSLWSYEFTHKQLEKAWGDLEARLGIHPKI